ncbi:MAG: phosphatidate cytidylyltransferase [Candidatus Izemoplasmataceae bacterium]
MKERVITGLLLAVLLIPLLFVPRIYFHAFIAVLIVLSARELVNMILKHPSRRIGAFFYTGGFAMLIYLSLLAAYTGYLNGMWVFALLIGALLVGILLVVFGVFTYETFTRLYLSMQYIAIPFFAVSLLRTTGLNMLVYLLILSMFTDMFAYFVGMKFGRTKLAPLISPKKTVEGFIGGTLVAAIVASVFAYVTGLFAFSGVMATFLVFIIGWLVAMSAQMGDLFASSMKRHFDIKDFSSLLPGHGGVLDRLDSTLFAALVLVLALFIYGGI